MATRCMDLSYFLNESQKRIDFVRRYALVKHQFPVPKELNVIVGNVRRLCVPSIPSF